MKKICITGAHGTGKTKICDSIFQKIHSLNDNKVQLAKNTQDIFNNNFLYITDQAKEYIEEMQKGLLSGWYVAPSDEIITLHLHSRYLQSETKSCHNMLCDESVLDPFIYHLTDPNQNLLLEELNECQYEMYRSGNFSDIPYLYSALQFAISYTKQTYSKIYLIEPSDREIEKYEVEGFALRDTNKERQIQFHKKFLEYYEGFDNLVIINQEEAHKPEFIESVVNEFICKIK